MEGGQAISHRLVGALLLVKPEPRHYCPKLCKGHSQGFVLALRASGLPAAGQGRSRVLTAVEGLNECRTKKKEMISERNKVSVELRQKVFFLLLLLPVLKYG